MADAVRNNKYRTILLSAEIMFKLILAVNYLHRGRILHGDISPNNVLFEGDSPILIDFGTSEILPEGAVSRNNIGTTAFCAPERKARASTLASDIYSLGATFSYLIGGNASFEPVGGMWGLAPHSLKLLVTSMMSSNPGDRPLAKDILEHRFFEEVLTRPWMLKELTVAETRPVTGA